MMVAGIEILIRINPHLALQYAPMVSDGKPPVYYSLGTDDTTCKEPESFTVS